MTSPNLHWFSVSGKCSGGSLYIKKSQLEAFHSHREVILMDLFYIMGKKSAVPWVKGASSYTGVSVLKYGLSRLRLQ